MKFYTYCKAFGSKVFYRGVDHGRKVLMKDTFSPTLFVKSKNKKTEWNSLYGDPLDSIEFADIKEYRDFIKQYEDVSGFDIHGNIQAEYQYLNHKFSGDIEYNVDQMKIMFLDIEVIARDGFPDIQSAADPIALIACHDKTTNKTVVFGFRTLDEKLGDFEYRCYKDEVTMLREFITFWQSDYPDIVSGWNSDKFDFPYIVNRIIRLLDDDWAKKLSPFNMIHEKMIEIRGGDKVQTYDIVGVNQIDYLDAYKKFGTYSAKESYALGFIAKEELGESKHEIEGAESFNDGYDNFYSEFVKYNAIDAQLVHRLDNKLKLVDLVVALSYLVKCNFKDTFGPVKMWDVFIYNHLSKKKVAIPPQSKKLTGAFEGAWCKDVKPAMYGWTMSFDFASLYPTIIRQWNVSPETLVREEQLNLNVETIVSLPLKSTEDWIQTAKEKDVTVAANGTMYRKNKKGILPELMEFLMVGRKTAKKEMLKLEQQYQHSHDESLLPKIAAKNALQLALKVAANAGYGACTNSGFRYYDLRIGEAITLTGQVSDRHVEKMLNQYMNKILKTDSIDYVIAGDTDSVYLNVDPIVKTVCKENDSIEKIVKTLDKIGEQIQKTAIQKSIDHVFDICNCFDQLMDMKREAIASKVIWTAKKRYAMMVHNSEGVDYKPYKLKIMGLDIVKSSTPQAIRKVLKDSLPVIFEQGEISLREYVSDFKAKFNSLPVEDIAFPRGVSEIDKWFDGKTYKSATPIHVRAAILYNQRSIDKSVKKKYDKIRNGDKIKFVYLKLPNPIKENVVGFPSAGELPTEFGLHNYIDLDTQFEKTFLMPLKGITDAIGWHLEEQSTLESFF